MISKDCGVSARRQCDLLGLNRSTYYSAKRGFRSGDLELMRLVDQIYTRSQGAAKM